MAGAEGLQGGKEIIEGGILGSQSSLTYLFVEVLQNVPLRPTVFSGQRPRPPHQPPTPALVLISCCGWWGEEVVSGGGGGALCVRGRGGMCALLITEGW